MNEEKALDIKYRLSSLVGKTITSIYKDGDDALCIEFTSGEDFEYLTVMGFFRLILEGKILLSSNDLHKIAEFEEPEKTIIEKVEVGYFGDVTLYFENGARLEVISNTSYDEPMWNSVESEGQTTSYFVVTPYSAGTIEESLVSQGGV